MGLTASAGEEYARLTSNEILPAIEAEDTLTEAPCKTVLLDPDIMFSQGLMADPTLAPQLTDPYRIASIKAYAKGTFPDRKPDISTPRTDVYILGWEDKVPDDPFYRD